MFLVIDKATNETSCVYDVVQSKGHLHFLIYRDNQWLYRSAKQFIPDIIPADEVEPVKDGRWMRLDAHKGVEQFKCSVCQSECYVPTCMDNPMYEYCPNCGARMDGGADNGE